MTNSAISNLSRRYDLTQPVCPSCKQPNETDMQFCIFCGSTLKPGSISGRKPTVAGETCQACGKADALNGKFCVLCGAKISKPAPQPDAVPTSIDVSTSSAPPAKPHAGKSARRGGNKIALLLGCIVLGGSLGGAAGWFTRSPAPRRTPAPDTGVSVLTGKPYASVFLQAADGKHFVVGPAGADGNFHYPDTEQSSGQYTRASTINGEQIPRPLVVKDGKGILDLRPTSAR
ncbi:MAG TPA: zinc ribbon domain-containing protein [Candidatus Obscuribacterales bacterium]